MQVEDNYSDIQTFASPFEPIKKNSYSKTYMNLYDEIRRFLCLTNTTRTHATHLQSVCSITKNETHINAAS